MAVIRCGQSASPLPTHSAPLAASSPPDGTGFNEARGARKSSRHRYLVSGLRSRSSGPEMGVWTITSVPSALVRTGVRRGPRQRAPEAPPTTAQRRATRSPPETARPAVPPCRSPRTRRRSPSRSTPPSRTCHGRATSALGRGPRCQGRTDHDRGSRHNGNGNDRRPVANRPAPCRRPPPRTPGRRRDHHPGRRIDRSAHHRQTIQRRHREQQPIKSAYVPGPTSKRSYRCEPRRMDARLVQDRSRGRDCQRRRASQLIWVVAIFEALAAVTATVTHRPRPRGSSVQECRQENQANVISTSWRTLQVCKRLHRTAEPT
jgi:hypothetical protein